MLSTSANNESLLCVTAVVISEEYTLSVFIEQRDFEFVFNTHAVENNNKICFNVTSFISFLLQLKKTTLLITPTYFNFNLLINLHEFKNLKTLYFSMYNNLNSTWSLSFWLNKIWMQMVMFQARYRVHNIYRNSCIYNARTMFSLQK